MKSFNPIICLLTLFAAFTSSGFAVDSLKEANLFSMELSLPIADGKKVLVNRVCGSDLGDGAFSWTGELAGSELGFASFSRVGDYISGTVHMSRGDAHVFRGQVDKLNARLVTSRTRSCASCRIIRSPLFDPRRHRRIKTWRNGDGNLVDLLVVYPTSVATDAGGAALLEADVIKAVADANLCYRNSLVNLQLRLVHITEVDYTPSGLLGTDLERLEGTTDTHLAAVHTLREQYGADLVALLAPDSDSGGLASTMMHPSLDFAEQGFSVSVWDQIGAPSYTLAHEIGHNMGCLHNLEDTSDIDSGYEFKSFSYGKRWISSGNGYGTVMSYDTEPISTYPNTIPYFSNPNVSFLGEPTGNAGTKDNAQVLNFTTAYVANFRSAVVQGIIPSISSVVVREANSKSFTIRLAVKPDSEITVSVAFVAGGDADLFLSSPATLTFDSDNWNLPHSVHVSARTDADDSNGSAILTLSATGMTTTNVTVTEADVGTSIASGYLISGIVTNSLGVGIAGANLAFSNSGGSVTTDANGTFRHTLASGWNGTLTPSKIGHSFTTNSTNISALSTHSIGHSFTGIRSSILYVNLNATGSGDGSSWADAYTDLAAALRSQHPCSEVWVARGTYKPGVIRPAAFLLPPGIALYGGFAGMETSLDERDITANRTILSGDLGAAGVIADNAYHVVIPASGSTLDGFTIENGNASENFSDDRGLGGALWAERIAFSVRNCTFSTNYANQNGGAVFLNDVNATFTSCTFSSNTTGSTGSGGALDANNSHLTFASCTFASNVSQLEGGAINSQNSALIFSYSSFTSNQNASANGGGALNISGGTLSDLNGTYTANSCAPGSGGGAIQWAGIDANFTGTTFSVNQSASYRGGAIIATTGTLRFSKCTFSGNTSGARGGAVRGESVVLSFSNSNFTSNESAINGGALSVKNAILTLTGNTFTSNKSEYHGGALDAKDSNSTTTNCHFTSNLTGNNGKGGAVAVENGFWNDSGSFFTSNISVWQGGAVSWKNAAGSMVGSTFTANSNTTYNGGGALHLESTMPTISNCFFLGNEAESGGALMLANNANHLSLVNCVFSGNKAVNHGGVLKGDGSTRFVNCSLAGNSADYGGVTILFPGDSVSFENSILWGNTATTSGFDVFVNSETATASYSLFDPSKSTSTLSGSGNLSNDPLFMDADGPDNLAGTEDDDLTLQSSSPAINQASSSVSDYSTTDLLGKARSGTPDLGAYEYRINAAPIFAQGATAALSILEDSNGSFTYSATDADADTLTWSMLSPASNGIASVVGSSGVISYVPNADWSGSDSFVLQVSDGVLTDEITVNMTVSSVADSPVITQGVGPLVLTMSEDGAPTVWAAPTLGGTDTDTAAGSLTWSVKTAASNGTATVSGTGSAPVTFTYAPNGNWSGSDSFVVQVSDGDLMDEITVNVTVIPVNDSPRITNALSNGDLVTSIPENNASVLTLTATDVESDSLTFLISGVDTSSFDLNVTTGVLSFKAAPDYENPDDANNDNIYELLVAVADGNTTSSSTSLFITVSDVIESSPQVLLTVTIEGNGTVTGSGSFDKDSNATLTATPALGYEFSQWSGDLNETANPLTLVMTASRSVKAVFELTSDSWMLAFDEGNGWLSFSWFGNYYETNIGWLYHEHHGWLYRVSESTNSVWLHDNQLGWLWTSSNTYPYLYQANSGSWLYYDKTSKSPRRFYRYSRKVWEEISGG